MEEDSGEEVGLGAGPQAEDGGERDAVAEAESPLSLIGVAEEMDKHHLRLVFSWTIAKLISKLSLEDMAINYCIQHFSTLDKPNSHGFNI